MWTTLLPISALKKLGMNEEKNKLSARSLASLQVLYFRNGGDKLGGSPMNLTESARWRSPMMPAPKVRERFELYIPTRVRQRLQAE